MASIEEVRKEAENRIQTLVDSNGLNPNVLKYFNEGRIYYSYLTAGGMMGSIDTISYDPAYEKAVRDFEDTYSGYLVYHAIESESFFGKMLSLLYVSNEESDWDFERPDKGILMTYTVNLDDEELSEFGDITLTESGMDGALVRQY